eukprot:6917355-Pyramimonas_sp.AAC.1
MQPRANFRARLHEVATRVPSEADRADRVDLLGAWHLPPQQFVDDLIVACSPARDCAISGLGLLEVRFPHSSAF